MGVIVLTTGLLAGFAWFSPTRIVLIGDSTVQSGHEERPDGVLWGWGTSLRTLYGGADATIVNRAIAGHSSRTFYNSGAFDAVLDELVEGDVLLIQFGHNDGGSVTGESKASLHGIGEEIREVTTPEGNTETVHTYGWYLSYFVQQAKAKGVRPIVVSPVPRNNFVEGFVARSYETYGLWSRQVAERESVDFLDLNNLVADLYDFMGEVAVADYFPQDALHTNQAGADATAEIVYNWLLERGVILLGDDGPSDIWEKLGEDGNITPWTTPDVTYPSITTVQDGEATVPYIVYREDTRLLVKRMTAPGTWEPVGGPVAEVVTGYSRIWSDNAGTLYVMYSDASGSGAVDNHRLSLKYYDATSDSWQPLGNDPANLLLTDQSVIVPVSQLTHSRNHAMAFDKDGIPYVVFVEARGDNVVMVKRFVDGAWEDVGGPASATAAASLSIAFSADNTPYVAYQEMMAWNSNTGQARVKFFKDGAWQEFLTPTEQAYRHPVMAIADDRIYIAFMHAGDASTAQVMWSPIGAPEWASFGRLADRVSSSDHDISVDGNGNVFVLYSEGGNLLRVFHLAKGGTQFTELGSTPGTAGMDGPGISRVSLTAGRDGNPYLIYNKWSDSKEAYFPVVQRYLLPAMEEVHEPNTWEKLGEDGNITPWTTPDVTYPSITTVVDGEAAVPYIVYREDTRLLVKRMAAPGTWEAVGGPVAEVVTGYSRIWSDNSGTLYVMYSDASGSGAVDNHRLSLKYYDAASGSWQPLGNDPANLLLTDQSVIVPVSQLTHSRNHAMAFDKDGIPYVVFVEARGDNVVMVKRFVDGAWEDVGGPASATAAASLSIAFSADNTPYVAYQEMTAWNSSTGQARVKFFKDGAWQEFLMPLEQAYRHPVMAITEDRIYIAFMHAGDGSTAQVVWSPIEAPEWASFGRMADRVSSTDHNIDVDSEGNVVVAYWDSNDLLRVFVLAKGGVRFSELGSTPTESGVDGPGISRISLTMGRDGKPYVIYNKWNEGSGVYVPIVQRYHLVMGEVEEPEPDPGPDEVVTTPRWMETLDRGVVAVRPSSSWVFVSWRLLGDEPMDLGFNVYRDNEKLNAEPIVGTTNYQDITDVNGRYTVVPVIDGEEGAASKTVDVWTQGHLSIPMDVPPAGTTPDGQSYTHTANDLSVGDLDGDGEYEIIVKWEPTLTGDMGAGYRGLVYLDAYKLDGTKLWRINLGKNIRAGAHYTQFLVYDFDGDGKSELAVRTSDGTIDGTGAVIGDADADHRTAAGYILSGPEFVTVFNGQTGAAMASADYIPERGRISDWGDGYGNRVDRFTAAVAYLDGERPSMVFGRGYYTRMVRAAWDWRDGQLTHRWTFDTNDRGSEALFGQGNHQMSVADIDNDGKDEIINGASAINDNGRALYATGKGHGDALHVTQMDPNQDKQFVWMPHESPSQYGEHAVTLVDASTGETLFGIPAGRDIGRAMAADVDPRYPGYEMWSIVGGLYNVNGDQVTPAKPGSNNFGSWWDGDLLRELLDNVTIAKWDWENNRQEVVTQFGPYGAVSNNGTKATPGLSADILGDWREEVIYRSEDSKNLLVFTTSIPTDHKLYTLMHDPQYRTAIAWQNAAYNQPPYPGFYLGEGMAEQEPPNITLVAIEKRPQEIIFEQPEALTYDMGELEAQATATSGLRVSYTSDNPEVVQVDNQLLKIVGVGTANITATQAGNSSWEAAEPVTRSLTVEKGIQTISFDDLPDMTVRDQPFTPVVTSTSGLPVTIESSDSFLAAIVDGQIEVLDGGEVQITATQSGNELWLAAEPVTQALTINALPSMDVVKVITPNGDGDHDVLVIREIERYPDNSLYIYDRRGQLLFEIDRYDNHNRVFNGRLTNGELLENGTYFYRLEWTSEGKQEQQKGWFYLNR